MNIGIPDDYQNAVRTLACFAKLDGHRVVVYNDTASDTAVLAERFRDTEALVLIRERTPITDELLAELPHLKLISQTGRGTDHIDLAACARRGIAVAVGTGSPYAPAELTWALVLASSRGIVREAERLRNGQWQTLLGTGLRGRTLGIWGYGRIGSIVAGYGRAFAMNVLVWGRGGSLERACADGYATAADKHELLRQSDVLSVHIKLNRETRGSITAADFAQMKPTALFVNTSRAELVEPGALEAALRIGVPGFAAVDVYEQEPVPASHPLLALENAVCTPHLGYVEKDSYELYFGQAFDNVLAFAEGRMEAAHRVV